jgi:hypothetical protein
MNAARFNEDVLRRMGGAGVVALLHLIVIAFLLQATFRSAPLIAPAHDGTIWFVFPPRTKPQPVRIVPAPVAPARIAHFAIPRNAITLLPAAPSAATGSLHAFLFDCAPENLANLSPDERAQCAGAPGGMKPPDDNEVYAEHATRSHNATHWARGVARKQQPMLLPCANPQSILATFSLATLLCLANAAKQGKFDLDELPGYGDTPENIHVPNNGDPPDRPPG